MCVFTVGFTVLNKNKKQKKRCLFLEMFWEISQQLKHEKQCIRENISLGRVWCEHYIKGLRSISRSYRLGAAQEEDTRV